MPKLLVGLSLVMVTACANNVPQDRQTGPDGKLRGAVPVALEEGQGKATGIVTYPGGDRVDWKKIELPKDQRGRLDLEMTYSTPRPGLKVRFDVFDQWQTPVKLAALGKGHTKSMSIDRAKGTYFIRVYAPKRRDAGTYKLTADFQPEATAGPWDGLAVQVPEPPRLPAVPDPLPTTCEKYDPSNAICQTVCAPGSPPTLKACLPPEPPPVVVAPPPPPPVLPPQYGRVMKQEVGPDGTTIVTISVGSENGVTKEWKGTLQREDKDAPLSNGKLTIIRIDKRTTTAKVELQPDVVSKNPNVVFKPK
ncbi:MAG TPA: hypothetical protein VGM39_10040 [Kofleriaceae bacterium]|jgi:hypothetical protein